MQHSETYSPYNLITDSQGRREAALAKLVKCSSSGKESIPSLHFMKPQRVKCHSRQGFDKTYPAIWDSDPSEELSPTESAWLWRGESAEGWGQGWEVNFRQKRKLRWMGSIQSLLSFEETGKPLKDSFLLSPCLSRDNYGGWGWRGPQGLSVPQGSQSWSVSFSHSTRSAHCPKLSHLET